MVYTSGQIFLPFCRHAGICRPVCSSKCNCVHQVTTVSGYCLLLRWVF